MSKRASMADQWSQLPEHLLNLVTKRLDLDDLIRFSYVCVSWKSFSVSLVPPKLNLPWLIVPYGDYTCETGTCTTCDETLGFFNLYNNKVYRVETPQLAGARICGSSQGGWLIAGHVNGEMQVFHPFSKLVFDLPLITAGSFVEDNRRLYYFATDLGDEDTITDVAASACIHEFYIFKAIMSSSCPTSGIVMVIQGLSRNLALCRPGKDKKWTCVKSDGKRRGWFTDITFYQGDFYAVQQSGEAFVVCDVESQNPFIKSVIPPNSMYCDTNYLVESLGELLMVGRKRAPMNLFNFMGEYHDGPIYYKTTIFKVAKLDMSGPKWVDVKDLGNDRALFIGYNHCFSLSSSESLGCKGNCIYFTDDYLEKNPGEPFGAYDFGVFSFKDNGFEEFYPTGSMIVKPPPIWFTMNSF